MSARPKKRSRPTIPGRIFIGNIPSSVPVPDVVARFSRAPGARVVGVQPRVTAAGAFTGAAYVDVAPLEGATGGDAWPSAAVSRMVAAFNGTLWRGARLRVEPAEADYLARLASEKAAAVEEAAAAAVAVSDSVAARRAAVEATVARRTAADLARERAGAAAAAAVVAAGGGGGGGGVNAPPLPLRIRRRRGERFLRVRGDPIVTTPAAEAVVGAHLGALPEAKRARQRAHPLRPRAQFMLLDGEGGDLPASATWARADALHPIPTPAGGLAAARARAETLAEVAAAIAREEEGGEGVSIEGEEEEEEEEGEVEEEDNDHDVEEGVKEEEKGVKKEGGLTAGGKDGVGARAGLGSAEGKRARGATGSGAVLLRRVTFAASAAASAAPIAISTAPAVTLLKPWRETLYGSAAAARGRSQLGIGGTAGGRGVVAQPGVLLLGKGDTAPSTPLAPFAGVVSAHKDASFTLSSVCGADIDKCLAERGEGAPPPATALQPPPPPALPRGKPAPQLQACAPPPPRPAAAHPPAATRKPAALPPPPPPSAADLLRRATAFVKRAGGGWGAKR